MKRALIYALKRGFAPNRAAYPSLAGRQGPEVSGPAKRVFSVLGLSRTTRRKRLRSSWTVPEPTQKQKNKWLSRQREASTSNELRG